MVRTIVFRYDTKLNSLACMPSKEKCEQDIFNFMKDNKMDYYDNKAVYLLSRIKESDEEEDIKFEIDFFHASKTSKLLAAVVHDLEDITLSCIIMDKEEEGYKNILKTSVNVIVKFDKHFLSSNKDTISIFDLFNKSKNEKLRRVSYNELAYYALSEFPFREYHTLGTYGIYSYKLSEKTELGNRNIVLILKTAKPEGIYTSGERALENKTNAESTSELTSKKIKNENRSKERIEKLIDGLNGIQTFIQEQSELIKTLKIQNEQINELQLKNKELMDKNEQVTKQINQYKENKIKDKDLITIDIPIENKKLFEFFQKINNEKSLKNVYNSVRKYEEWLKLYDNDEKKLEEVLQTLRDSQNFFKVEKILNTDTAQSANHIDATTDNKVGYRNDKNSDKVFSKDDLPLPLVSNLSLEVFKLDLNVCFKLRNESDISLPNNLLLFIETDFGGNNQDKSDTTEKNNNNSCKLEITHGISAHSNKTLTRLQNQILTKASSITDVYIINHDGQKLLQGFNLKNVKLEDTLEFKFNPVQSIEFIVNDDIISNSTELTLEEYSIVSDN